MDRMSRTEGKRSRQEGRSRISAVIFPRPGWQNRRQHGAKQNFAERSNRMNRTYEIMFIVRPDVEEAELDKLIEGFSANVTSGGGEVKSVEKMGRRRLAYTVRKFNDGFYVLLNVAAAGSLIAEIERRLRVSEQVIKFITVRMDEEEKRLAKVKAIRDTKVKRIALTFARRFSSSSMRTVMNLITCSDTRRRRSISAISEPAAATFSRT